MTAADDSLKEQTARVVGNPQCSVDCPNGCSHLMWACARCSCEGGWGGSRERLQEIADQHVCPPEQTPYTPTTEEVMRGFTALPYMVKPRMDGEDFASWLSRCSIETMNSQIASEDAARRWLAAHEQKVRAEAWEEGREAESEAHFQDNGYGNVQHPKNPYIPKEPSNE